MRFIKGDSVIVKYLLDFGVINPNDGGLIETVSLQECTIEGFMSFYQKK